MIPNVALRAIFHIDLPPPAHPNSWSSLITSILDEEMDGGKQMALKATELALDSSA
jgi:hypothetical protein